MLKVMGVVGLTLIAALPASAQSFSCPIGSQASCLGFNDKVVDRDASCFSQFTCNFDGFMCVSDHNDYVKKAKRMAEGYDDFRNCVARATDMDAIRSCVRYDSFR